MDNTRYLVLAIAIIICANCSKRDSVFHFARYLRQEKRLRAKIRDTLVLEDSLNILRKEHNIDPELELMKLQQEPADWIELLRKLRRDK